MSFRLPCTLSPFQLEKETITEPTPRLIAAW